MKKETVKASASGGISVGGLLWIVLIVLKIMGEISMSWFWVITACIWIPSGIVLAILGIAGIFILLGLLIALIFGGR